MKGSSMHMGTSSHKAALKPGPPLVGSFVDGKRTTYDEAEAADAEGKAVTHTNKEADKKAKDLLKKGEINQSEYEEVAKNKYKPKGKNEQKAFNKAKADDAKAQALLEKRKAVLSGKIKTGKRDEDGRQGTEGKRKGEAAFEKANETIKTEKSNKPLTGDAYQGVKGAETTISNKAAQKSSAGGTKNTKDYERESKKKKMDLLKNKKS